MRDWVLLFLLGAMVILAVAVLVKYAPGQGTICYELRRLEQERGWALIQRREVACPPEYVY